MKDQPNYYAILTADVRYNENLSSSQKLFFAEITALTQKTGKCWASNGYFAKLYDVAKSTISSWVKALEEEGFINVSYQKDGKQIKKRIITLAHSQGVQKSEQGSQKSSRGYSENPKTPYSENPKENNTSKNNTTSQNITRELAALEFSDFGEDEKDKLLAIQCYNDIKAFNPYLDGIEDAKLDDWVKPIRSLLAKDGLTPEKLATVWDYTVNKSEDDFWKDKLTSTAKFKQHFPTIYGQYKNRTNERAPQNDSTYKHDSIAEFENMDTEQNKTRVNHKKINDEVDEILEERKMLADMPE